MVKLYRCKICGDPYIGTDAPKRCPHCGAYENFMIDAKEYKETFDVELNEKDKANVEKALQVEISNAEFYFCAAAKAENDETKNLFKALAKVEAEHASIWKKILKLDKVEISKTSDECSTERTANLQESHDREDHAIKFYAEAAAESENDRIRQIFGALVQVETDHLKLSEVRLK
ncbi:MAG: ferritin family protein [Nanoarchaeota archaeon]|nr:ferritin family protein [Nanoarchaeota archaeon]